MKCFNNHQGKAQVNLNIFILFFFQLLLFEVKCSSKSFMDLAREEVFKKEDYESDSYRKEAASLNPEYYTEKGKQELEKCRNLYQTNYDICSRFKTCNFCAANSDCGWCNEKKLCVPVSLNSRNDQIVPLCQGDCIRILKIEYCYKGLFEPENTQNEVNFANYDQILKDHIEEDGSNVVENMDNIFEKALEKNFLQLRNKEKKINSETINPEFKFKEKLKGNDPNCTDFTQNFDSPADELSEGLNFTPNHFSLNYITNASTNKPLSLNLENHHKRLYDDMKSISKNVFSDLVNQKVDTSKYNIPIIPNLKSDNEKQEEMMNYLKEYIPNFEFPQYVTSDLEDSIDKIKKEKLLLWLRGYSLNEPISKHHLPIYKNLTFVDEEETRKNFLDKFYKDIVKDPYKNLNSQVYKNLIGEENLFGENIHEKKDKRRRDNKYLTPIIKVNGGTDVMIVPRTYKTGFVAVPNPLKRRIIGKTPLEVVKNLKVINSKYIDPKDLFSMVKNNNMRFKQNNEINNKKTPKSLKEISTQLKEFLKNLK